jgi:transposase
MRGNPQSQPAEVLLKAVLLQCLYSVRSERENCRRTRTDILFRWFLDMEPDAEVFDHADFPHDRKRLEEHGLTGRFVDGVARQAREAGLKSDEQFSMDGTLIQSQASLKSPKRIEREESGRDSDGTPPTSSGGRNAPVDFRGERRSNATHQSTTDPEARLARKGEMVGAFRSHSVHAISENRHGLVVAVSIEQANGHVQRESALRLLQHMRQRHGVEPRTLGMDAVYDAGDFLPEFERRGIVPHVPVRPGRIVPKDEGSLARMRRILPSYRVSERRRKKIEEVVGWVKTVGLLRRVRHVGLDLHPIHGHP